MLLHLRPVVNHRYLLFYKPYNVLTQFTPGSAGRSPALSHSASPQRQPHPAGSGSTPAIADLASDTLKAFIPVPDVYPVGRLDKDSEGLLLLTSDGKLQHRLSHPKFGHPRTYWVQVEQVPDEAALNQLRQGVVIQGDRTRPAQVRLLTTEPDLPPRYPPIRARKAIPTAWLELTLREGRNRQVRRMTAAVGFPTLRLVRVAIAHLHLTGLQPGEWRDLTPAELAALQQL
ncbi:MAG: pseudouridine synthase [Kaiparowitsia implicata GSE-PSE-MK54-09C]|nr:pseudouridine synthase [Kaiparowitsia implicata GSE-PSE-MK54-09C]